MTLPNFISILRLFLTPVIIWLILKDYHTEAFYTFVIAGISDLLDGALARLMDSYSEFGKYLDPIADKVLLMAVFITLGIKDQLPSWLVLLTCFRDFLIAMGALLLMVNNRVVRIRPLMISKVNTLLQIILVTIVLFPYSLTPNLENIMDLLVYMVTATCLISGANYAKIWIEVVNES